MERRPERWRRWGNICPQFDLGSCDVGLPTAPAPAHNPPDQQELKIRSLLSTASQAVQFNETYPPRADNDFRSFLAFREHSRVAFPFKFCALRYLIQWQRKEAALHISVKKAQPEVEDLLKALRHFQVARNFKGLKQPGEAKSVRDALLNLAADILAYFKSQGSGYQSRINEALRMEVNRNLSGRPATTTRKRVVT